MNRFVICKISVKVAEIKWSLLMYAPGQVDANILPGLCSKGQETDNFLRAKTMLIL